MKKMKSVITIFAGICLSSVFIGACAAAPEKEDTSWVFDSIDKYNKEKTRQYTQNIITETEDRTA